ncbi:MAG: FHA domain-containing protein [Verrucomicrobiia bacterium]
MPRLISKAEEFEGWVQELTEPRYTVGRTDDNDICLPHASISSHHAELVLEDGDYKIIDLNSTNGTRVNDERITDAMLRNADVLMIGHILLRYQSENVLDAPPLPEVSDQFVIGQPRGRPEGFRNLSPVTRKVQQEAHVNVLTLVAGLLALGAVGFYAFKFFTA